ncbi:Uncharacterised protein [Mycobacteroides abscessus]|nr:Uncharacterised protein [Mycobacteroides abscessus]SKS92432.1 Uncharacterised protein [Mycobacteroides abscessus subsp. abscessus]
MANAIRMRTSTAERDSTQTPLAPYTPQKRGYPVTTKIHFRIANPPQIVFAFPNS